MCKNPVKDVQNLHLNWWVSLPDFLVAIQTVSRYTNNTQWSSSSGQSSWGQWNLASSYLWRGEGVGQQKNHTWVGWTVGLREVFLFFRSDPENRVEIRREFFFQSTKTSSPWSLQFFYLYGLRRWQNPWSCLFTGEFFIFHPIESDFLPPKTQRHFEDPKNISKKQVHSPCHEGGSNWRFWGQKKWLPRFFFGAERDHTVSWPDLIS